MKKPYGTAIEIPDIVNDMTDIVIEVGPCPCYSKSDEVHLLFKVFNHIEYDRAYEIVAHDGR